MLIANCRRIPTCAFNFISISSFSAHSTRSTSQFAFEHYLKRKLKKMAAADAAGDAAVNLKELNPSPSFIQSRQELWEKFKKRHEEELASKVPQPIKIEVTDKNGEKKTVDGESWRTSPLDVARQVGSKSWAESMVIAKVNGVLWDLERCLEDNCVLDLLKFDDNEGNDWNSLLY